MLTRVVIFAPAAIVDADKNLFRELFAHLFYIGRNLCDRRQVFDFARFQIHAVHVVVFVAVFVLHVDQMAAGVGPKVIGDAAMRILSDWLGGLRVIGRADPDVQHVFQRRHERQLRPVRTEPRPGLFRVAEKLFPRDQRR